MLAKGERRHKSFLTFKWRHSKRNNIKFKGEFSVTVFCENLQEKKF